MEMCAYMTFVNFGNRNGFIGDENDNTALQK